MEVTCLHCGKTTSDGNKGRKFCNHACKTSYHNEQKRLVKEEIKEITGKLMHNRKILMDLLGEKPEVQVYHNTLVKKGFDFTYHTHHVISKFKQHLYVFSFNYGFHEYEKERYKL